MNAKKYEVLGSWLRKNYVSLDYFANEFSVGLKYGSDTFNLLKPFLKKEGFRFKRRRWCKKMSEEDAVKFVKEQIYPKLRKLLKQKLSELGLKDEVGAHFQDLVFQID